jgi:hypothetical protein
LLLELFSIYIFLLLILFSQLAHVFSLKGYICCGTSGKKRIKGIEADIYYELINILQMAVDIVHTENSHVEDQIPHALAS